MTIDDKLVTFDEIDKDDKIVFTGVYSKSSGVMDMYDFFTKYKEIPSVRYKHKLLYIRKDRLKADD